MTHQLIGFIGDATTCTGVLDNASVMAGYLADCTPLTGTLDNVTAILGTI